MILIRTCWYLCATFLVTLGCASVVTVAPGGEATIGIIMLVLLVLSILSGATALLLHRKFKKNPDSPIFKSKAVSKICIGIAAILTVFLLFAVV